MKVPGSDDRQVTDALNIRRKYCLKHKIQVRLTETIQGVQHLLTLTIIKKSTLKIFHKTFLITDYDINVELAF